METAYRFPVTRKKWEWKRSGYDVTAVFSSLIPSTDLAQNCSEFRTIFWVSLHFPVMCPSFLNVDNLYDAETWQLLAAVKCSASCRARSSVTVFTDPILIVSCNLRLHLQISFLQVFTPKLYMHFSTLRATCLHLINLDLILIVCNFQLFRLVINIIP